MSRDEYTIFAQSVTAITGGNSLEKAPSGPVTDFVKQLGGHTVITKVSRKTQTHEMERGAWVGSGDLYSERV